MLWTLCDGHGGNGPSDADDDLKPEARDECRAGCLDHGTDGDPEYLYRRTAGGPFHTSLMHPAGDALREKCKAVRFAPMQFPVLFNCLGHEMEETDTIAALLEKQVQSGVRWEVTVRRLAELGVDAAIEIGPGRALTGFVKKTVGSAISCYPVETAAQLQQLLRTMKGA